MRKNTLFTLFIILACSLFSVNLKNIKDFSPKNVNLYLLNQELDSIKRYAGDYEIKYNIHNTETGLVLTTNLDTKYDIEIKKNELKCNLYDEKGLWQTFLFEISKENLLKFNRSYRFPIEGQDEPLMIDVTRLYSYDEKGRLLTHKQPTEYSERTFHYLDDKIDYIENIIGNGETSFIANDKYTYINDTDYDVTPSHELLFHSIHYPVMDKKEHRVAFEGDVEVIKDTYYYDGDVYFEYIEKWDGDRIISFENYISVRKQTVKFLFDYKN